MVKLSRERACMFENKAKACSVAYGVGRNQALESATTSATTNKTTRRRNCYTEETCSALERDECYANKTKIAKYGSEQAWVKKRQGLDKDGLNGIGRKVDEEESITLTVLLLLLLLPLPLLLHLE
ncbi:hypothetical protein M0802_013337 [Mischocyttarus mexicanus]|nr:hypothetical protein M0802_013337 [Mischocyttarus mexicanus]